MICSQDTLSVMRQAQTRVLQTAEPDYLDEEVHLGAESIIRSGLCVQDARKARHRAAT
jgi:hypothetical protein